MMKERLPAILLLALAFYIAFSLLIIAGPRSLARTKVSRLYRTYLLPGPFFSQDRIVDNYSLYVSWKSQGQWSPPVCPASDNFRSYHTRFYPSDNYRNRFERSLYQGLLLKPGQTAAGIKAAPEFQLLVMYLSDRYRPGSADSIRLVFTRKRTGDSRIKLDTLYTLKQK